jgi:hypothetical protein
MDVSSRSGHHVTTQLILVHVAVVHEESKPVRDQLRLFDRVEATHLVGTVTAIESQEDRLAVATNVDVGSLTAQGRVDVPDDEHHTKIRIKRISLRDVNDVAGTPVPIFELDRGKLAEKAIGVHRPHEGDVAARKHFGGSVGGSKPGDVAASRHRLQVAGVDGV